MSLVASDIRVRLGRSEALKGVTFEAAPGQLTAIVGPNGSGKTTLLRAITGDVPFDGSVELNGQPTGVFKPWELAAIRGVLPQHSTLSFPFRAAEVVRIGLQQGVTGKESHIVAQALARVGLGHKAQSLYQELSGGEQHRVQLARVLAQIWEPVDTAGQPRWLLLDEPVASLDIAHQLEVMDIAAGFAAAGGGVVAVMHDLNLTAMYAARVAVMAGGQLLAQGTPRDVLTDDILSRAYGCNVRVGRAPREQGAIFILPHSATLT